MPVRNAPVASQSNPFLQEGSLCGIDCGACGTVGTDEVDATITNRQAQHHENRSSRMRQSTTSKIRTIADSQPPNPAAVGGSGGEWDICAKAINAEGRPPSAAAEIGSGCGPASRRGVSICRGQPAQEGSDLRHSAYNTHHISPTT